MLERLLLPAVIAATSLPASACRASEAAESLPAPVKRDAGVVDAAVLDAIPTDAAVIDAPAIDAATIDAAIIDAALPRDAQLLLRDGSEAPPLYDARILMW